MPITECSIDGKSGYKWGEAGKCYTHDGSDAGKAAAKKKAMAQGMAEGDMMKSADELVAFGGSIKALGDGKIGGWLIEFGDATKTDLENDYFTPNTDYDIENGSPATVYYNHGFDGTLKKRKLGKGTMEIRDVGVWIEAQLELRDEYEKAIYDLVKAGKMGWSSGSVTHLVERKSVGNAREIVAWPLGKDASITPTPAAGPNGTRVQALKSLETKSSSLEALLQEVSDSGSGAATSKEEPMAVRMTRSEEMYSNSATDNSKSTRTGNMAKEDRTPQQEFNDQLEALKGVTAKFGEYDAKLESLSTAIDKVMNFVESMPAKSKAGFVTDDGGSAEPQTKSFADFLFAIKRHDVKRLSTVYKSRYEHDDSSVKDLVLDGGNSGGYLVPQEFETSLLQLSMESSPVVSRVQSIPVARPSGSWPVLDQFTAPTAGVGDTAYAAGVTSSITAEGGALSETEPDFNMIQWRLHKIGGYTQVSNELITDSPMAIEALLRSLFAVAVAAKTEYYILRGNGVGQPLGILNSAAIVNVTPNVNNLFSWADVASMQAHFKKVGTAAPIWLIHPSVWPDILTMQIGTGNTNAVWSGNMQAAAGNMINGYPIVQSEHLPQANNSGDVLLLDLYAYLLFQKSGGLSIAFSDQVGFLNDLGTWRFTQRLDGQPWLKSPITLADPTGSYTVSPFLVHND